MSFGLRNAAQSFQYLVVEILRDLDFAFAYIGGLLIVHEVKNNIFKTCKLFSITFVVRASLLVRCERSFSASKLHRVLHFTT